MRTLVTYTSPFATFVMLHPYPVWKLFRGDVPERGPLRSGSYCGVALHRRYLMAPASAQLRVLPERKDGGHPTLCNAPPPWIQMRHQSHQSHQSHHVHLGPNPQRVSAPTPHPLPSPGGQLFELFEKSLLIMLSPSVAPRTSSTTNRATIGVACAQATAMRTPACGSSALLLFLNL